MTLFFKMFQLQLQLLLLMVIGVIAFRKGIVTDAGRKSMSSLLINIILPCNILNSFLNKIEVNSELLTNCIMAVVISLAIQLAATYGSKLLFRSFPKEQSSVMSYGMIVSNSSFIGIPVVEYLYGALSVMYTSVFQIPIRVTMWTAGLTLFTSVNKKDAFKAVITHPCVIAVFTGFLLMLIPVEYPVFITGVISAVSKCTTAVSMIIIGSILAEIDYRQVLDKGALYFSFIRLVASPLLVMLVLRMLNVPDIIMKLSVILTTMPAGNTTAILAEQYGADSKFAARIILVSTLMSVITIPVLCLFL